MRADFLKQKMDEAKDMVLSRVLVVLLFFMAFGITISLMRIPQTGFKFIYGVQIFLAISMVIMFIFQNKMETVVKGAIFLTALYGMGLSSLLSFGLYGFGYAYFIPAAAIAYLYFNRRVGWILTASSLLILVLTAIFYKIGILHFRPTNPVYMETVPMWMNMIITVLLISIVITMFWNNMYNLLNNTFTHIHHQQQDMTKMNEQLIIARDKAQESDRLKSSFLQNISHEIRTPLNIIIGFSDMVAQTKNPKEHLEFNKVIRENSNIMLKLVNDIVDFSKIETNTLTLTKSTFNIREVLDEIEKRIVIDEFKTIDVKIDKIDLEIESDKERFLQIIFNLIDNALKFTNEGSINLSCRKNEKLVHIKIKDTGIGIPEVEQTKIFTRFYKIDQFTQGAGLGLTVSKSMATLIGGDITVESVHGKGTTFEFTFPYMN